MKAKACFASSVCSSDKFVSMPEEAQVLYFQLCFEADADGAITGIERISRSFGYGKEEIDKLTETGLLVWPLGVPFIADWWVNNRVDNAHYKSGAHKDARSLLELDENRHYIVKGEAGEDYSRRFGEQSANDSRRFGDKVIQNNQIQTNPTQSAGKENDTNETDRNDGPHFARCPDCGVGCTTANSGGSVFGWCSEHGEFEVPCKPVERESNEGGQ